MTTKEARDLQVRITKEAAALLAACGSGIDTAAYEKGVALIGHAWQLPAQDAGRCLALIQQEKDAAAHPDSPELHPHPFPESELPMNASGLETLNNVWGLFETAIRLDDFSQRAALFELANELAECQNLPDWIRETEEPTH